jgi:hypothetical protein
MEMKPLALDPAYVQRQDAEHLNILSILHYVMAGLTALGGFVPLIYIAFGVIMVGGAAATGNMKEEERTGLAIAGVVITVIGLGVCALIWLYAFCLFLTGKYLAQGRNRTFCFVTSAIQCLNAPLGTALGIFTIIVLSRDSVKARFEQNPYAQFQPPSAPYKQFG